MNPIDQHEERSIPEGVALRRSKWPGTLILGAGLLTPLAATVLSPGSGRLGVTAAVALALLSLGAHRLIWTRPAPYSAWQRVFISLVVGTIAYCLVWVMPAQVLGLLGGALKS